MHEPADESADREHGERVAESEAIFRRANDALRNRYRELAADELAPFLCECGDARCTRTVRLTLEEFEEVRNRPGHFAVIRGHAMLEAERIVEENDRYHVVEKPLLARETTIPR